MLFHKKSNIKAFALAACVFAAWCANVNATTYYVDGQGGNDGNNGQSLATAWRTVGKANAAVQPGDTVYLRAGTYSETIRPDTSGTAGNYITYARYNTEEVVITGVSDGVDLRNRSYIMVDGMRIVGVLYWVNMKEASSYNIIQNCYMDEATGWGGVWLRYESHYNRILNNTIIGYAARVIWSTLKTAPATT